MIREQGNGPASCRWSDSLVGCVVCGLASVSRRSRPCTTSCRGAAVVLIANGVYTEQH